MRNNPGLALIIILIFSVFKANAQNIETRQTGDFTSFSVMGKIRVEIYPCTKDSLVLEAEGATTDYIITDLEDGELNIRLNTDIPKDARVTVQLYYNDLDKITAASNALILSPDTLKAESMSFEVKSGAKMELTLNMKSIIAEVKQGAILVFYGSVDNQEIGVSSGGTYSAFELKSKNTFIKATTTARAKLTATESIDATANTTGYIAYKGNPAKEKIKANLGGEVVEEEK